MGIPLGGGRKRRSYADYRPRRGQGPRSDPFRVILYLMVIGAGILAYLNADLIREFVIARIPKDALPNVAAIEGAAETATPTLSPEQYIQEAEEAYRLGLLTEAIEAYRGAGAAAPNVVEYPYQEARLLIFRSALEYGETREATLEEALDAADRAILAQPGSPLGYIILAKVKDWQGEYVSALNDIQRAAEFDDNNALVYATTAEILMDLDRWEDSQAAIDKAMQIDPNSVDVHRDYGYVLESLAYYAEAQVQYQAALQLQPRLPNIMLDLARMYRLTGNYDLALEQLAEVETMLPENALIPFEIGVTYETYVGDPNMAIASYEQAAELDPSYVRPWMRLGVLYYFQGSYPEAIFAFEKAIDLGADDNVDVVYQLGLAYANNDDCAQAIPMLQKARTLAGEDERIIDLVNSGFETCSAPTPTDAPPPTETDEP